jgi:hypothetical protein
MRALRHGRGIGNTIEPFFLLCRNTRIAYLKAHLNSAQQLGHLRRLSSFKQWCRIVEKVVVFSLQLASEAGDTKKKGER